MNRSSEKILIIRFSSLGDVLLSTPLIRLLAAKYPQAKIDFLVRTEYSDLLRFNPHLNNLIEFDISGGFSGLLKLRRSIAKTGYRTIVDIHRSLRSRIVCAFLNWFPGGPRILKVSKNQFARFLLVKFKLNIYKRFPGRSLQVWEKYIRAARRLGIEPDDGGLELTLPLSVKEKINSLLQESGRFSPLVIIAPGARHFTKQWPVVNFVDLIGRLYKKYGWSFVLVGGKEEQGICGSIEEQVPSPAVITVAGKTGILETAELIRRADLFITNDSGLMHVSAAWQVPTLAIFGSTVRELGFFPLNPRAVVVENDGLGCRPCSHIGRAECPKRHFKCMEELTPEILLHTIETNLTFKKLFDHRD